MACTVCINSTTRFVLSEAVVNARISAPTLEGPLQTGIDILLSRLNPDQRAAARHGLDGETSGPRLVIAGSGSGKTNTLRMGWLASTRPARTGAAFIYKRSHVAQPPRCLGA